MTLSQIWVASLFIILICVIIVKNKKDIGAIIVGCIKAVGIVLVVIVVIGIPLLIIVAVVLWAWRTVFGH